MRHGVPALPLSLSFTLAITLGVKRHPSLSLSLSLSLVCQLLPMIQSTRRPAHTRPSPVQMPGGQKWATTLPYTNDGGAHGIIPTSTRFSNDEQMSTLSTLVDSPASQMTQDPLEVVLMRSVSMGRRSLDSHTNPLRADW